MKKLVVIIFTVIFAFCLSSCVTNGKMARKQTAVAVENGGPGGAPVTLSN